jgi:site-specific recombinase XerD
MDAEGLEPARLTVAGIERFLVVRRRTHVSLSSVKALAPGLEWLRRIGVVPAPPEPVALTAIDNLERQFRAYLVVERGLLEATADSYVVRARPFLADRLRRGALELESLSAADVSRFVAAWLPGRCQARAKSTVTALRSLLRFLHATGVVERPLASAVPTVPSWRLVGLPTGLNPAQVRALLDACDRTTPVGRRDFAVVSLLTRLGLRAAEVGAMTLDDIDWRAGTITVHGKGNRHEQLPLPADVGTALAAYLEHGRPAGAADRAVFLRAKAPYRMLDHKSISTLVGRAARRAGLGTVHAHLLRHSAATTILGAGASLDEVGQLLRHRSSASTAIYAKVDLPRLSELTRPWPGWVGRP